jgi:hypothetical protein
MITVVLTPSRSPTLHKGNLESTGTKIPRPPFVHTGNGTPLTKGPREPFKLYLYIFHVRHIINA